MSKRVPGTGERATPRVGRPSLAWEGDAAGVLLVVGEDEEAAITDALGPWKWKVMDPTTTEDPGAARIAVMREVRDGGLCAIRPSLSPYHLAQLIRAAQEVGAQAWLVRRPSAAVTGHTAGQLTPPHADRRGPRPRPRPPQRDGRGLYDCTLDPVAAVARLQARTSRAAFQRGSRFTG